MGNSIYYSIYMRYYSIYLGFGQLSTRIQAVFELKERNRFEVKIVVKRKIWFKKKGKEVVEEIIEKESSSGEKDWWEIEFKQIFLCRTLAHLGLYLKLDLNYLK